MTTYLIIGNGVAANAAAENLRKYDPDGKIVNVKPGTGRKSGYQGDQYHPEPSYLLKKIFSRRAVHPAKK